MLVVARHGNTPFLKGEKRIEGYSALPLDDKGKKQVKKTAESIHGLYYPFESFTSSDLLRARQTSDAIENKINMPYESTKKLRTWNPGIFEGRSVDDYIEHLNEYIDNPHDNVPGTDESYSDFYNRVKPYLKSRIEDKNKVHLITTHNRVITLLKSLEKSKGEYPNLHILHGNGPIEPGGVLIVHPDWNIEIIDHHQDYTHGE